MRTSFGNMPPGLVDKLYWRWVENEGQAHCFKKIAAGGYESLCGRWWIPQSNGQRCSHPCPELRCGRCDGLEMQRRFKNQSLDASPEGEELVAVGAVRADSTAGIPPHSKRRG